MIINCVVVVESMASTANVAIMAPCHNYSPTDILVAQLGSTQLTPPLLKTRPLQLPQDLDQRSNYIPFTGICLKSNIHLHLILSISRSMLTPPTAPN